MGRNIAGLSEIKTNLKKRLRSMPEVLGDKCLNLYVLTREKARLEQALLAGDKKAGNLRANLMELENVIRDMEKALAICKETEQGKPVKIREGKGNPRKTICMEY